MNRIGWAILGAGGVSSRFAAGLDVLGNDARIIAIASRNLANAQAFARRHGGTPTDYARAVTMDGVDAVYLATPPSLHEEHASLAFAAGKAVLVEKPFAEDAATASRIAAAARAANVFCMEAMWTRFMPMVYALRGHLPSLGQPRALQASFMGSDVPDPMVSLFAPERGGGALRHRGIYGLSLARLLFGPAAVVAAASHLGETGVDEDCTVVLRHSSGALSTVSASIRAPGRNHLIVSGTRGMIEVAPPIYRPFQARITRVTPRQGGTSGSRLVGRRDYPVVHALRQRMPFPANGRKLRKPYAGNGYHYEAAEVALRLAQGATESPEMPLDETVDVLRLVDAARARF